jgi:hypothetical protein
MQDIFHTVSNECETESEVDEDGKANHGKDNDNDSELQIDPVLLLLNMATENDRAAQLLLEDEEPSTDSVENGEVEAAMSKQPSIHRCSRPFFIAIITTTIGN